MATFRRNLTPDMSGEEIAKRLGLKFAPESKSKEFEKADVAAKKFIKEAVACSIDNVLEYHRLWTLIWTKPELEVRAIADRLLEKARADRHKKQFGHAKRRAVDPKTDAMKAAKWLFCEWALGRVNFNSKAAFVFAVQKAYPCLEDNKNIEARMDEWRDALIDSGNTRAATLWKSRKKK